MNPGLMNHGNTVESRASVVSQRSHYEEQLVVAAKILMKQTKRGASTTTKIIETTVWSNVNL